MGKKIIVGIGEILWDILPEGKKLGGAPANFAWHCQQLGAAGAVISAVGKDSNGIEILDFIKKKNLLNGISINDKPTGTVEVMLQNGIPEYLIHENVAWDFIDLNEDGVALLKKADAICFGTLAQRNDVSRNSILKALQMVPDNCLKIFDINLRQNYYSPKIITTSLENSDILKINSEELEKIKDIYGLKGDSRSAGKMLLKSFNLKLLAITYGENGSLLMSDHEICELGTPEVNVADTIGAGDSFTAALAMGMLAGKELKDIHKSAVEISAFVCSQNGAMPVLPENIRKKSAY